MRTVVILLLLFTGVASAQTSPETEFTNSYKDAHASRDISGLRKLSCLDRIAADDQTISDPRSYNFDEPIKAIRIVSTAVWPLPSSHCDPSVFFVRDGLRYEFNLPVVASLHIDYVSGKKSVGSSSDMPLGFKDGKYWIASLVPAGK